MEDAGGEETNGIDSLKNFERALGHVRNRYRYLCQWWCDKVCESLEPTTRFVVRSWYWTQDVFIGDAPGITVL